MSIIFPPSDPIEQKDTTSPIQKAENLYDVAGPHGSEMFSVLVLAFAIAMLVGGLVVICGSPIP